MKSFPISGAVPAALVVALGLALSGCATVTRSPSTNWTVTSLPEGAEVTSSNGDHCDATPCSFRVPRKEPFAATVSKAGYEPTTLQVTPELRPWGTIAFVGNTVVGGLVGMGIDAWTGSMLDPSHNGETVKLKPYAGQDSIRLGLTAEEGCSQDKARYARQIGVPCDSLSQRVVFNPGPLQAASSQPATDAAAQPVETASRTLAHPEF